MFFVQIAYMKAGIQRPEQWGHRLYLRVSKVGELEGLDLHEHGAVAYPDYALVDSLGHNGSHNGNHNGTPSLIPAELTTARD